MDFEAGLPILVASFVAVVLSTWLQTEQRWIQHDLLAYAGRGHAGITSRLDRVYQRVRRVVIGSTLAAPAIMLFSGQLDAHGAAQAFDGNLQLIAPFTSACFSAATAWLLVASPRVVHGVHLQLLELFRCPKQSKEFW
jgi:hypothetical protein